MKTVALATEARENGADVIAFAEVWISGCPWFLWLDSVPWQSQFVLPDALNSLEFGSAEFAQIELAADELGIAIARGYSERDRGLLYIAQAFIDSDGVTKSTRRKLTPMHVERTQFGDGDGSDIRVVDGTDFGRVGSLSCWEHLQPWAKYAMFARGSSCMLLRGRVVRSSRGR